MSYQNKSAASIPNGSYRGSCDVNFIYAEVEVVVQDGAIEQIELLEHRNDRGSAAEGIGQRIVEEQTIDVDTVSGATNSSKVIKKAVDNALSSAVE